MFALESAFGQIGSRYLGWHTGERFIGILPVNALAQQAKLLFVDRLRRRFFLRFPFHQCGAGDADQPGLGSGQCKTRQSTGFFPQQAAAGMAQRTEQKPVRDACAASHSVGRQFGLRTQPCTQLFQGTIDIFHTDEQNQLLLGARHRHIQHAEFLAHLITVQLECGGLARQNIVANTCLLVRQADAQAKFRVKEHIPTLLIETAGTACQYAQGEFQPLTAVDAHDAHGVSPLPGGLCCRQVGLFAFQPIHKPQKTRKATVAGLLIAARVAQKQAQVGEPQLPAAHGLHKLRQVCAAVKLRKQAIRRQGGGQPAEGFQFFQKGGDGAVRFGSAAGGKIQGRGAVQKPHTCQIIGSEAVNGAHHHGGERNIQQGIVNAPQKRERHQDLPRGKETACRVGAGGNAQALQFTRVFRRKTVGTAQQDTAVGPAQRPFPFPFPDTQPLPLFPQKDGETAAFLHGHLLFFLGSGQIQ